MKVYQLDTVNPLFFYQAIQYFAHSNPGEYLLWAKLSPGHYSLGAGQTALELDVAQAKAEGRLVLRRPTGGGLVWVEQEYVFAVLFPLKHRLAKEKIILAWLQAFYQQLGISTTLIHNDLWHEQRKLAGSASAHLGAHWVFTSSFLQKFSPESFVKDLIFKHELAAAWFSEALKSQMTDAETLGVAKDFLAATQVWREVLADHFGEELSWSPLSAFEQQQIENTEAEVSLDEDILTERRLPCAYKIRQGSYLFDQADLLLWLSDGWVQRLAMPLPLESNDVTAQTFWRDLQAHPNAVSFTTFQCFQKFWQKIHDEYPDN